MAIGILVILGQAKRTEKINRTIMIFNVKQTKPNNMKKIYSLIASALLSASLWAQAPQSFSYQAVVRGANNELVVNKQVSVKISILQTSENGTPVYIETHTPTANANGLVSVAIGAGTPLNGTFTTIDWAKGPYFLKTETDLTGGTAYSLTATSQLLSVPFALYAANSQPGPKGEKGDQGMPGKDGMDGKNGQDGKEGPQGPIGPKGDTGAIGSQGPIGLTGLSGKDGVDGKNGLDGKEGPQGPIGPKGDTGSLGPQGPIGLTGSAGKDGVQGPKGDTPDVKVTVSAQGDTLRFENGNYVIIPGISAANSKPTSGYGKNITDVDGNTYKTVYIGTQQWMAENLNVSKYNDGTEIPNVTDNTQWSNLTTGAWVYYDNNEPDNNRFGKLYNWYAVSSTTNGNKNVCPTGWHVPSDTEWTILTDYLGGLSVAGGKMKEVGTLNWNSSNTNATNTSLFSALPGGNRNFDGNFVYVGFYGTWWSSPENGTSIARGRFLSYDNSTVNMVEDYKTYGLSVRCLKD